jgi:ATP-binding cassette, subfamily B, bacterial
MEPIRGAYNTTQTGVQKRNMNQSGKQQKIVQPRLSLPTSPLEIDLETTRDIPSVSAPLTLSTQTRLTSIPSGPLLLSLPSRPLPPLEDNTATTPVQSATQTETLSNNAPSTHSSRRASWHKKRWRRVPELRQMSAVECGACCLAMVLNYYGHTTSVSAMQERCGVGRDGLSALAIVKAARQYGLRVRTVSLKQNDFRFVSLPANAHWEFNHFVIVERCSTKHVDLVDPALGRRRLSLEEFSEGFTGILMMLEPGAQFERQSSSHSLTLWSYLRSLPRMNGIIAQIIASSLLLQLLGLGAPLLTALIVDQIIPAKDNNMLLLLGLGMLFLILAQGVTKLLRTSLLIYLQTRMDAQMMLNFCEHLLSLPYRFFQLRLSGDLLSRVDSNTALRDLLTSQVISTMLDGSTVIVYLVILILESHLIAGVAVAIGVIQILLLLTTAPLIRRMTMRDLAAQGKTQGYLNEVLAGIATLKAAGAEHRALTRWTNLFFDEMNISVRRNYLLAVVGIVFEFLQLLSPLLLLWIGAMQVIQGTMSVGTMLALITLASSFLTPLGSLASSGQKLQIAQAHFERLADVLGSEVEQDIQQVRMPPQLTGRINLRNVFFQYDPHTRPILKNITLHIRPGQKVALVGKTGSGKSTLGKLLIGLMTPTKGSILFDGIPLQQLNYQEVRRQFGVVLQESFIFSGSVHENIAFNNPEMEMNQVIRAAQAAAIHEDIEKMPMGYETLLSEGGSVFSGGQRQRLALARALAHHPAILLLDEATSASDVATERAVEQNINTLSCTQVVIAHRLSTIRNADLILVLDQGQIVEQGSHHQLLRKNGFYARLIKMQVENGEIEAA